MERWPGTGEEWRAVSEHDRPEVKPKLINESELGQAAHVFNQVAKQCGTWPHFQVIDITIQGR